MPTELHAKLLLPYLNEKSKSLLFRLAREKQDSYEEVKKFLLSEFRLTPIQFKNRFDQAVKGREETCTMFVLV